MPFFATPDNAQLMTTKLSMTAPVLSTSHKMLRGQALSTFLNYLIGPVYDRVTFNIYAYFASLVKTLRRQVLHTYIR